jgi:hypothetical protein
MTMLCLAMCVVRCRRCLPVVQPVSEVMSNPVPRDILNGSGTIRVATGCARNVRGYGSNAGSRNRRPAYWPVSITM